MHRGHVISGLGHLGLVGWLLLGDIFQAEPLPFEVNEVSVISGAEFEALLAGNAPSPQEVTPVAQPAQPAPEPEAVQPTLQPETPVETTQPQQPAAAPLAEVTPEAPDPLPQADVSEAAPLSPDTPAEVVVLVPEISRRPVARPVERVAPEPVAQPEPEARPDPQEQQAVAPEVAGETPREPQEATAPEEATTEIVTEAAEAPRAAPRTSMRPPARRPAAPPRPTRTAQAGGADENAVASALQEALAGAGTPAAPSGPPLSSGEKENLRVAVSACWNVGSLSSEALRTTVTVAVKMNQNATPIIASLRMTGFEGGSKSAADQAFEAARRAIIRCGSKGYDLPVEKFSQWQDIEMTFNPERMRVK